MDQTPTRKPAAESASGDEVLGTAEAGGGVTVATGQAGADVASVATSGDSAGDPPGNGEDACASGDAVCLNTPAVFACVGLCATATSLSCHTLISVCVAGDTVTLGTITIPCGIGIMAACVGSIACMSGCAS